MRCPECGGHMETKHGVLQLLDETAGILVLEDAEYSVCNNCESRVYPVATAARIDDRRKEMIQEQINQLPIGQFVTMRQAASILGVSKQAFSKNRRIRAGFIYSASIADRELYFKPSVVLFDNLGDGRFSLWQYAADEEGETAQDENQQIVCTAIQQSSDRYMDDSSVVESATDWEKPSDLITEFTSRGRLYMPDKEVKSKPTILPDSEFRTLFADNLHISTRKDGMHLIQFFASLPDGWSEQARLLIPDIHLKSMLDVLTGRCEAWKNASESSKK